MGIGLITVATAAFFVFGGSKKEYKIIFKNLFNIKKMETCKNSIPQRLGRELFINLEKKQS